jgi:PTH1 family peptidyl-tRNA hydrolase
MKLLVGLGNPGRPHLVNRHNIGFLVVEAWSILKGQEIRKAEFHALTARVKAGGEDVLVMQPQTYMNRSGEAVAEAMRFFKLSVEDLIVVHDELDIPPMSFRIKKGGGTAGHNGLRSLGGLGENYLRLRMGIGRPPHPEMAVADFVLGDLSREELGFWEREMPDVCEAIDLCLAGKAELAMNRFNKKGQK